MADPESARDSHAQEPSASSSGNPGPAAAAPPSPPSSSPIANLLIELAGLVARWFGLQFERASISIRLQIQTLIVVAILSGAGLLLVAAGIVFLDVFLFQLIRLWLEEAASWCLMAILHLLAGILLIRLAIARSRAPEEEEEDEG